VGVCWGWLAQEMASTEGFKFSYHRKSIKDLGVPSHEEMTEILDIIELPNAVNSAILERAQPARDR
jgi:hypothetical protein